MRELYTPATPRRATGLSPAGVAALVAALMLVLAAGAARAGEGDVRVLPPEKRMVFASEDSTILELAPIDVQADRVPLIEIIRRAREHEAQKYDGIGTMAYTRTIKVTLLHVGKPARTRCTEAVDRIYYRSPDQWAVVPLRKTRYELDKDGIRKPLGEDDDEVKVSTGEEESARRLSELPFYLERLDEFRFPSWTHQVKGLEATYIVDFEPMSDFSNLPGGRIWIYAPDYQIVREEFNFRKVPFPWIVKSIDNLVREWQHVNGHWVEKRITARADLGMNFLGIPRTVEIVALYDDYRFDLPVDAALFGGKKR